MVLFETEAFRVYRSVFDTDNFVVERKQSPNEKLMDYQHLYITGSELQELLTAAAAETEPMLRPLVKFAMKKLGDILHG